MKENLELLEISIKVTSTYDSNPSNNVDEEKLHLEETHEWYVDSNRILYPKEYLDNYYDEIK